MSPHADRHGTRRVAAVLATALLGAALATGVAHAESGGTRVTSGYDTSQGPGSYGPALGAPITRAQIVKRAADWVSDSVAYDEGSGWEDGNVGGPYRSDCSGMVSMAWDLPTSLITETLPDDAVSEPISSLQQGDMLDDTAEHAVIFDSWVDTNSLTFNYYYESSGDARALHVSGTLDATDFDGHPSSDYGAYEYDHVQNPPPAGEFYQDIRYSAGGWQGWAPLDGFNGAANFEGPAQSTTAMPDGSSQDLGVGLNGLVYHDIRNASGSWQGWEPLKGYNGNTTFSVDTAYQTGSVAITDLPVASTSSLYGTSEMLAIGQDDRIYYDSRSGAGAWSGFTQVPGLNGASNFAATKVAIAGLSNGSSVIAAYDATNGDLYYTTLSSTGAWGTWTAVPGYNTSANFSGPDLSIAASPNGTVQFLAVGVDDMVYYNTLNSATGVFKGWSKLAGYNGNAAFQVISAYDTGSVGIAAMPDGSVQMLAIGQTDLIYQNILSATGTWQGWDPLQNLPAFPFAAATVSITGMPNGDSQILATSSG